MEKENNNNKRLSLIEYSSLLASFASGRSEDTKTKVGACLVNLNNKRILSTSYNGVAPNMDYPEEFNKDRDYKGKMILHAENNLFRDCFIPSGVDLMVCLTISPCEACAKVMCGFGIKEVYYIQEYPREKEFAFKKLFDFYNVKYRGLTNEEIGNMLHFTYGNLVTLKNLIKL